MLDGEGSKTSLEDVAYLSRSANRVEILDLLTNGSYSRRDVAEMTGASRTTLDRIVNELEERGWVERTTEGGYAATAAGSHLMVQLAPFLESVEAIRRLDDALDWLPIEEVSIGLHHFRDATVLRPERDDPMETVDYFTELIRDATSFRVLTHLAPPVPLSRTMRNRIASGRLTAEYVITDELVEYLRDQPERRRRWQDIVDSGATVFQTTGPLPCNLWIFDDLVLIKKSGPEPIQDSYGVPIQSENETVRSWAHDLIDRCRADAVRVNVDTFRVEPAGRRADSGVE